MNELSRFNEGPIAPTGLSEGTAKTISKAVRDGTPTASLKAFKNDMNYLEAWHRLAFDADLAYPANEAVIMTYYAHHLFALADRADDAEIGMPAAVEEGLRSYGYLKGAFPPAYATVMRRVASWSKAHNLGGFTHGFGTPKVREGLKALRSMVDTHSKRKSERAITSFELLAMLEACPNTLLGWRDRAMLMLMYASGGRRRSEPGKLMVDDVSFEEVPEDPALPFGPRILACKIRLARTKRTEAGYEVAAVGEPAVVLKQWIEMSGIERGALFPRFHVSLAGRRKGDEAEVFLDRVSAKGLSGSAVANIVKQRLRQAGLDESLYSAHGIRSGFLTDAQANGVPLADAMLQSTHRSAAQAMRYYNASSVMTGSARLLAKAPRRQ